MPRRAFLSWFNSGRCN